MCGRFTLTADISALQESFPWLGIPPGLEPRYNIAPSQPVAVAPNDGKNRLDFFTWGLIPSWAKDPAIGNRMINARAETLAEKPSFRSALPPAALPGAGRRLLRMAQRWREEQNTHVTSAWKTGRPLPSPGCGRSGTTPDGSQVYSCTIITTEPNPLMATIHNRMPVILPEKAHSLWLQSGEADPKALSELLKPYPAEEMVAYPVSKLVNSPANDVPAVIEPLS